MSSGGGSDKLGRQGVYFGADPVESLRFSCTDLGHDDQFLGARFTVLTAEDRDITGDHTGNSANCLFELLRIDVATGFDDDITRATCDVEIPACDIPEITGIEPVAVEEVSAFHQRS